MKSTFPLLASFLVGLTVGALVFGQKTPERAPIIQGKPEPLIQEIERLRAENEELRREKLPVALTQVTPSPTEKTVSPAQPNLLQSEQLKDLDRLLELTTAERSLITDSLEKGASVTKAIKESLAPERQREYSELREKRAREEESEEIEEQVFRYSRKLQLEPAQEQALRSALTTIVTDQRPLSDGIRVLSERASDLHATGDREGLQEVYQEMKGVISQAEGEKRQRLQDSLSTILTDEQINALVQLQESEKSQFFEE